MYRVLIVIFLFVKGIKFCTYNIRLFFINRVKKYHQKSYINSIIDITFAADLFLIKLYNEKSRQRKCPIKFSKK